MPYTKATLDTDLVPGGLKYGVLAPEGETKGLPLLFFLHGGGGDRRFLENQVGLIEQAIADGVIEPLVAVESGGFEPFSFGTYQQNEYRGIYPVAFDE